MSSSPERQYVNILPPEQSNTAGTGVTILAATTTAAAAALPEDLGHRYVIFQAKGDEIWVAFGSAAAPDVDKSKTGGATFAAGTNHQNGVPLADGQKLYVRIHPDRHAFVKWQANASNSKLLVYPASPKGI